MSMIELIVVMALFSLLFLVGVQALSQAARSEQALGRADDETRALAVGLSLLRADLAAAIPVAFYPPREGPRPAISAPARAHRFALSLGGQATEAGGGPGQARVIWRLDRDTGIVTRERWPTLIPGFDALKGEAVPVFREISALTVAGYAPPEGWSVGLPKPGAPLEVPRALRVTLVHARLDRIDTVVGLR